MISANRNRIQELADELYGHDDYDTPDQRMFALLCEATYAYAERDGDRGPIANDQEATWTLESVQENATAHYGVPDVSAGPLHGPTCSCCLPVPSDRG